MEHRPSNRAGEPVFFDCEASSLDGYLIEVGWAFVSPVNPEIVSAGYLIQPAPDWKIKDAWSRKSEKLHGISLDDLRQRGRPVEEIAEILNREHAATRPPRMAPSSRFIPFSGERPSDFAAQHRGLRDLGQRMPLNGRKVCIVLSHSSFVTTALSYGRHFPYKNQKARDQTDWHNNKQRDLEHGNSQINRHLHQSEATKENT
jgi:hypothetical protein